MPHIFYRSNDFSIFLYSPARLRIVLLFVLICSDCHSHAIMLIELGFTPLETADRLGHESVKTTLDTYSHLYPNKDQNLVDRLNLFRQTPWQRKTLETTCQVWYIKHKKSTHSKSGCLSKISDRPYGHSLSCGLDRIGIFIFAYFFSCRESSATQWANFRMISAMPISPERS